MKFDRVKFWKEFRSAFYPSGGLMQPTVDNLNFILPRIEVDGLEFYGSIEAVAYCLATWKYETRKGIKVKNKEGKTVTVAVEFSPTTEVRASASRQPALWANQNRYWKTGHFGRGLTMITWADNYYKLGEYPGIKGAEVKDLERDITYKITGAILRDNPFLALDPNLSYLIASRGARFGLFRPPNSLDDFFIPGKAPKYVQARDIINGGRDKAEEIAAIAYKMERVLRASLLSKEAVSPEEVKTISKEIPREIGDKPQELPESYKIPDSAINPAEEEPEDQNEIPVEEEEIPRSTDLPTQELPPLTEDTGGATGQTHKAPPATSTDVKPTSVTGRFSAIAGFILTNISALFAWLLNLPDIILGAIILGGSIVTATFIFSVINLKNKREERANQKDLALIASKKA